MDGFGDMGRLDVVRVFQVGNRAADFQNSIISASRQTETRHGPFQHRLAFRINAAMTANQAWSHSCVREDPFGRQSFMLTRASSDYPLANGGRIFSFRRRVAGEFAKAHRGDVNMDVDAV